MNKTTIHVCKNYLSVVQAVLNEIDSTSYTVRCHEKSCNNHNNSSLNTLLKGDLVSEQNIVIGCTCIGQETSEHNNQNIIRTEYCLDLVAPPTLIQSYLNKGYYILTSAWLHHWEKNIEEWGFNETTIRSFINDFTNKIVVFDTGEYQDTVEKTEHLSQHLSIHIEKVEVGLDFIKLRLKNVFDNIEINKIQKKLNNSNRQNADFAMINEFIKTTFNNTDIDELTQNIYYFFNILFAAEIKIDLFTTEHSRQDQIVSNNQFTIPVNYKDSCLGVITVINPLHKEHMEKYIVTGLMLGEYIALVLKMIITIQELSISKERLIHFNKNLEIKVSEELKKRYKSEAILFQQQKFADMGEMINAISHQWRQPLNNLYLLSQTVYKLCNESKNKEEIGDIFQQQENVVNHMSSTIDDFRHFFSTNKNNVFYSANCEIQRSFSLISAQLDSSKIYYDINCKCEYLNTNEDCRGNKNIIECQLSSDYLFGIPGEFRQVIMNLISNAKDAISDNLKRDKDESARIAVTINIEDTNIHITIYNSHSYIPEDVLPRIFDPYYTTKGEGKGTGIGLYMSKMIIEKSMKGRISANNCENGVEFHLYLPKKQNNSTP